MSRVGTVGCCSKNRFVCHLHIYVYMCFIFVIRRLIVHLVLPLTHTDINILSETVRICLFLCLNVCVHVCGCMVNICTCVLNRVSRGWVNNQITYDYRSLVWSPNFWFIRSLSGNTAIMVKKNENRWQTYHIVICFNDCVSMQKSIPYTSHGFVISILVKEYICMWSYQFKNIWVYRVCIIS